LQNGKNGTENIIIMALELGYESFETDQDLVDHLRHVPSQENELLGKECVVCTGIETQWDHYQLPCKHYGHTRCLRKWFSVRKRIECPWCRESTPRQKYCVDCQQWGNHSQCDEKLCPKYKKFLEKLPLDFPM
jgi:hypothetical protein